MNSPSVVERAFLFVPTIPEGYRRCPEGRSETKTLIFGLLCVNATLFGAQKRSILAVNSLVIASPILGKLAAMEYAATPNH